MTTPSELAAKIHGTIATKRSKQKVLEEDEYLNKIDAIVQRDFFPDIPELQKKLDYFEAISQNDAKKAEEVRQRLPTDFREAFAATPADAQTRDLQMPSMGVAASEKYAESESSADLPSLDAFLQRNTSEDNSSFASLMNQAEKQRVIKHSWAYPALMAAYRDAEADDAEPHVRAIEHSETGRQVSAIETWQKSATPTYALMYTPGVSLNEAVARPSAVHAENTRFDEAVHEAAAINAQKRIVDELLAAHGVAQSGRIGVDGVEQSPFGGATPKVAGWKLAYTPTPDPAALRSPLMTWGALEGTPLRLDTATTHFKMPDLPARDKLAFELCDRVTSANRGSQKCTDSPFSRGNTPSTLSAAARALTGRLMRPSTGIGAALQRTYSPATRSASSSVVSTPKRSAAHRSAAFSGSSERSHTPRSASRDAVATPVRSVNNPVGLGITDNLLDAFMPSGSTAQSAEPTPKRRKETPS